MGEAKCRIGDWELDLIIGGMPRGAWISLVGRASKCMVLIGEAGKTAAVTEAIVRRMAPIRDRVQTGTADHGQELAGHQEIAKVLGTDFRQVTPARVRAVEEQINHWPRQVLGVRTPEEVFTAAPPGRRSFLAHLPPSESPYSTGRVPLGRHPPKRLNLALAS